MNTQTGVIVKTIIISFIAVMLHASAWAAQATIRLADEIAVQPPEVTLGQIASIECSDESLREKLLHLKITKAPSIKNSKVITAYKIRQLLEKQGIADVEITGEQSVISLETKTLSSNELKDLLIQWAMGKADPNAEATVNVVQVPKEWVIPAGKNVRIDFDIGKRPLEGTLAVTLRAYVDDLILSITRATVEVNSYHDAYVMAKPLLSGEKLTMDHLKKERVESGRWNGMEIAHPEEMVGLVANKNLGAGQIPKVTDFTQPVIITRGSKVRLIVLNGPVQMALSGAEALQNGKKGEKILFKNPMNQKETLTAEVVKPGVAVMRIQ
jgi:flagella basal body P-ring formation protein FlgA